MKYWEIIADRLHAEGWSYGIAEHFTKHGFLFCVDAHRNGPAAVLPARKEGTQATKWSVKYIITAAALG